MLREVNIIACRRARPGTGDVNALVHGLEAMLSRLFPEEVAYDLDIVVVDEPAVRLTIVRILERQGFRVLQAAHGGEAMRVAAEAHERIDLVISDLTMPEMSGREFVERFSAARSETRVLFMSRYTDDGPMPRGVLEGQHDFIEKPFTVDQISRKIQSILARENAFAAHQ